MVKNKETIAQRVSERGSMPTASKQSEDRLWETLEGKHRQNGPKLGFKLVLAGTFVTDPSKIIQERIELRSSTCNEQLRKLLPKESFVL